MANIDLLVYVNDNGTTVTDVSGNTPEIDFEEWFVARVNRLEDDPNLVTCLHVWRFDDVWYAEPVWHPEYEKEAT